MSITGERVLEDPEPDWQHIRHEQMRILDGLEEELWKRAKRGDGDLAVDLWIQVSRRRALLCGIGTEP